MGTRINTIMQTCFFAISGVLPRDEAIEHIKHTIEKTYGKRGPEVVQRNFAAVDDTLAHLQMVTVPAPSTSSRDASADGRRRPRPTSSSASRAVMLANQGDLLPVSAFPIDGTWPTGTAQWEKRNIALEIPVWDASHLHPVQQVRAGLPACRHSRQGVPGRTGRGCARDLQVRALQGQRVQGPPVLAAGGARRLHGLLALRGDVPGQGQVEPAAQGDRHGRRRRRCASRSATTTRSSSTSPRSIAST